MFARPAITLAVAFAIAACSSSSSPSPSDATDGGTPAGQPRSFKADVVPIFAQSCASQACHGDPNRTNVGIHFTPADTDATYAQLQLESPTAKGIKFVVPGDPSKSFLFAKVNGDEGDFSDKCTRPGCGETMPPGSKIPSAQRDTIQQWITEGAPKN